MVRYPPGSNTVISVADNRGDSPSKLLRDPRSTGEDGFAPPLRAERSSPHGLRGCGRLARKWLGRFRRGIRQLDEDIGVTWVR
jgi:hypothetical protein